MTSQEMMKESCKPGYWFVNIAPIDKPQNWQQQVKPPENKLLFGYEPHVLMAMQYK